jgi:uncharacterized Ntn-hydrolase superfamily protein
LTWSIIARDPATGHFGIAVATRFFAVGARVPFGAAGVGAIATQALTNSFYGADGLRLLGDGVPPEDVVGTLTEADAGRDHRQVHVMDRHGRIAQHTGSACVGWCGHLGGDNVSIAGNMLAGEEVLRRTMDAYLGQAGLPLPQRLIAAMRAGEAAGGDKRGKQSAALMIYGEEDWPDLDLRVDDHPDPLQELERLESVSRERFVHFRPFMPGRRNRVGVTDRAVIEAGIAAALEREAGRR